MPDTLLISFRQGEPLPEVNRSLSFRGFSVEHTRINRASDYAFAWTGSRHYLALHDLVLADGSMTVDGLAPVAQRDLRETMTYVPTDCSISGWAQSQERSNGFTILYFDPQALSEEVGGRFDGGESFAMVYFQDRRLRSTLLKLQMMLADQGAEPDPLHAETLALLASIEMAQLKASGIAPSAPRKGGLSLAQEKLVRGYVDDNLTADIALDDLAALVGLSRFHFARAFKASVGESPHRYVLAARVERAKALLSQSRLTVAEIAAATGFGSAAQFVRTFREHSGATPGAYRRSLA